MKISIETTFGPLVAELDEQKAPTTVANFLKYVDEGFFDGTIFHRVIPGFMVQGGGFTTNFEQKPGHDPIKNEADNGLKNKRATLAMARTMEPHSASNQFFINLVDNDFLDFKSPTPQGWGYAVFGEVVEGMEVIDKIAQSKTGNHQGHQDVPVEAIVMTKVSRLDAEKSVEAEAVAEAEAES